MDANFTVKAVPAKDKNKAWAALALLLLLLVGGGFGLYRFFAKSGPAGQLVVDPVQSTLANSSVVSGMGNTLIITLNNFAMVRSNTDGSGITLTYMRSGQEWMSQEQRQAQRIISRISLDASITQELKITPQQSQRIPPAPPRRPDFNSNWSAQLTPEERGRASASIKTWWEAKKEDQPAAREAMLTTLYTIAQSHEADTKAAAMAYAKPLSGLFTPEQLAKSEQLARAQRPQGGRGNGTGGFPWRFPTASGFTATRPATTRPTTRSTTNPGRRFFGNRPGTRPTTAPATMPVAMPAM